LRPGLQSLTGPFADYRLLVARQLLELETATQRRVVAHDRLGLQA
jgi:hypothetical protein